MKREAIAKWVCWRKWASITETESKPSGNLRRMERERECVGGGGLGVMRSEEYKVEEGLGFYGEVRRGGEECRVVWKWLLMVVGDYDG